MNDTPMKRCSKCGVKFPATAEYFSRDKSRKDGLKSQCKQCQAAYNTAHKEEIAVYIAAYKIAHKEEIAARSIAYRAAHKEEIAARQAAYRATHREEIASGKATHYAAHRKEIAARRAAYRQTEQSKRVQRISHHNRRALLKAAPGKLTSTDESLILKAHTDRRGRLRCARCGKVIKPGQSYHLDHFIPLDKGGTNDPGNIRVMHDKCNLSKGAKHPFEIGMLI